MGRLASPTSLGKIVITIQFYKNAPGIPVPAFFSGHSLIRALIRISFFRMVGCKKDGLGQS
jgi:hypothetical protein